MIRETMTREERLQAAINLEIPDRVPVAPLIFQFALKHHSRPIIPVGGGDPKDWPKVLQTLQDTFDELGGYDAHYVAGVSWPISSWRVSGAGGGRYVTPGQEGIPEGFSVQYVEQERMTVEDYDTIIDRGWNAFLEEYSPRVSGLSLEQIDTAQKMLLQVHLDNVKTWNDRDVPVIAGALIISCEMTLSLARTLPQFTLDLHRYPDKVQATLEAMIPDFIQNAINDTKASGIPRVVISLERGSGSYYNLKTYERFFFPQLKKIVDALAAEGLVSVLHMDTDWTLNLPYLRELPKKMCICELDSTSDIFKAKEILQGHMCIMGDVPPSLLSLGTREEVIEYCERLMDIVGKGGGFILSTGCECPVDAKFDNVRAMIDTPKKHAVPGSN